MKLKVDGKSLILFQLQFLFSIKLITAIIPKLSPLAYCTDLINLLIAYYAIGINRNKNKNFKWLVLLTIVLCIFDLTMLVLRRQSILLFLWGMRNQYRFILFTILSAKILRYDDLDDIFKVILRWFRINIPIVTVEFLLGYEMDYLGGTFGLERGCNAIVNIFLCVVATIVVIYWLNKKMSNKRSICYIFFALYWAALSELKMFFIEFIIIACIALFLVRGNLQIKMSFILISFVSIVVTIYLLVTIFPYYSNFFKIASIIDYANNVNLGAAGFGRITSISYIIDWFFNGNMSYILWGMGTGSAEFSTIFFLNSNIYKQFEIYQYFCYFHAFMFIERGYFGLFWYMLFFGSSAFLSFMDIKRHNCMSNIYLEISIITSICSIITMVYDIGLRTSTSGYLAFLMCSLPYLRPTIISNSVKNQEIKNGY